jgi:hypothetical protein
MREQRPHIHWLYLWLAISAAGNLLGLASLVDNVVVWADFFKHIIELYRDNIRAPVAWVGNHLWPFGKLPGWVFDVVIVYSIFVLSANIAIYREKRRAAVDLMYANVLITMNFNRWLAILMAIAFPIVIIYDVVLQYLDYDRYARRRLLINTREWSFEIFAAFIVVIFMIILVINYQILKLQAPH